MDERYKTVTNADLRDGMEVIVEHKRFDYKRGFPVESEYYRAIVGHHNTVSGPMFHLVNEPNLDWPVIAPWAARWIYAGNNGNTQMWAKEEDGRSDQPTGVNERIF